MSQLNSRSFGESLSYPNRLTPDVLPKLPRTLSPDQTLDHLSRWIRTLYLMQTQQQTQGFILQVSGGTDSALALWLCEKALPGKVEAVHFGNKLRGADWFQSVCPGRLRIMELPEVELTPLLPTLGPDWYLKNVTLDPDTHRWAAAQTVAKNGHRWLVGTLNRSELELGNYSLASRAAVVNPLEKLWKSEVIALCKHIGVPDTILKSSYQIDCDCGRPKELLQAGLHTIDAYLMVLAGELHPDYVESIPLEHRQYIDKLRSLNNFRKFIPYSTPEPTIGSADV